VGGQLHGARVVEWTMVLRPWRISKGAAVVTPSLVEEAAGARREAGGSADPVESRKPLEGGMEAAHRRV
jgi:hypothetical protein